MEYTERAYSILCVSASDKFNHSFPSLLPADRYHPLTIVTDAASAKRALLEKPADLVVINTPLSDSFGTQLALELTGDSGAGILLLVKAAYYPDTEARAAPLGVLVVSKPTAPQILLQSLQLLCGTRERLRRMEQKTATLAEKMEEIRLVNHAKWVLIEQLKMTETEAHRFIEKQAMDRCITRRAVAEGILATYA